MPNNVFESGCAPIESQQIRAYEDMRIINCLTEFPGKRGT